MENSIQNKNQEQRQQQQQTAHNFQKFEVFGDLAKADLTWQKYGQITAPLVVRDFRGVLTSRSKHNLYLRSESDFNNLDTYGYKKIVPSTLKIYPHEELDYQLGEILHGQLKDLANFSINETITAHNGDTKYWTILSDEVFEIEKGDEIKVGVVVRNGIGTDVALGVDIYTYRLTCSNGAVARGPLYKTFSIAHVREYLKVAKIFTSQITEAFTAARDFANIYRKLTQIRVSEEIANKLYQRLSDLGETYLPKNWAIPKPQEVVDLKKKGKFFGNNNLVKPTKSLDLWETFNEVTAAQRDRLGARKITFPSVAWQQTKLHQAVIEVVNSRKVSA